MAREKASHLDCSAASRLRPLRGEAIEAGALAFIGEIPGGGDPGFQFEAVERGVEGAGLDLEEVFGGALNVFGDGVPVGRSGEQGAEDEEVERALEEFQAGG